MQAIIGVITPDTVRVGPSRMLASIETSARAKGNVLAVAVVDPAELQRDPKALDLFLSQPIVGVIVLEYSVYEPDLLASVLRGLPVATVTYSDGPDTEFPHVVVDDRAGAYELTHYLVSLGHTTVHHVAGSESRGAPHPRELGWRDALTDAGLAVPAPIRATWSPDGGRQAGRALATDTSVTAVFCSNDEIALGVMRALTDAGRQVPGDISVVGMDDHPHAAHWTPSLTTYRLDWEWAGTAVVELLADPVNGLTRVGPSGSGLIVRESTQSPSVH
jgi:Transcriptional regulators